MERVHIVDPNRSKTDKSGFFHKTNSFLAILAELIVMAWHNLSGIFQDITLLLIIEFNVVHCNRTL